jgi:hypothetical protein
MDPQNAAIVVCRMAAVGLDGAIAGLLSHYQLAFHDIQGTQRCQLVGKVITTGIPGPVLQDLDCGVMITGKNLIDSRNFRVNDFEVVGLLATGKNEIASKER